MASVRITCVGAALVDYKKILAFQGELKELLDAVHVHMAAEAEKLVVAQ